MVPDMELGPKLKFIGRGGGSPRFKITQPKLSKVVEDLKYTLVAKFSGERPPSYVFDQLVNTTWGLESLDTVGLLDYRRFSTRL